MKQSNEKRVVTTLSIPDNKVKTFLAVKKILEEEKLGSVSSLFLEFIDEKYSQIVESCSLDYFTPKLNCDAKHKQTFLLAIREDNLLWNTMGDHIQTWINKYNTIEKGRIDCL